MKHLKTIALALLITFSAAVSAQSKSVNVEKSTINWVGKKVTGEHSGTIKVKIGALTFKKKNLGMLTGNRNATIVPQEKQLDGDNKFELITWLVIR